MGFQWKQLRGERGEMEKWVLIHKDTGRVVIGIELSHYASTYQNYLVRWRLQRIYSRYFYKVWMDTLQFF